MVMAVLTFLAEVVACAECKSLTVEDKEALVVYVGERFHVPSEVISLQKVEQANTRCFLRLEFQAHSPVRSLTLYLTPDHLYLVPAVYDINADPRKDENEQAAEIMKVLAGAQGPKRSYGTPKIAIVAFSDFECPFCKKLAESIQSITGGASPTKDISMQFLDFPLPIHTWATTAAIIGRCVSIQNKDLFWTYHDYLFANQDRLTQENVRQSSLSVLEQNKAFSKKMLETCADDPSSGELVAKEIAIGKHLGVTVTPTIFINGIKSEGAPTPVQLQKLIEAARSAQKAATP